MSLSSDPPSNTKPVIKGKNPHHYRKVGYSMIVISVSLVLIGLLVWAIGSDWHFSTNIMANQEIQAMTPRSDYNIVLFDASQPVGAKLKLLDTASTLSEAQTLRKEDAKQNEGSTLQVLIFNSSATYNLKKMADAEVYLQTPKNGYNVVLLDNSMPVGQKLTLGIHELSLENATKYQASQVDNLKGQDIKVLIFTPDFRNDLKMITGSSTPVGDYLAVANNVTNVPAKTTQAEIIATHPTSTNNVSNVTSPQAQQSTQSNRTSNVTSMQGIPVSNHTAGLGQSNTTTVLDINQTIQTTSKENGTAAGNLTSNATSTKKVSKTIDLNETVGINSVG
ncbi:MAG: hypothetical protein KGI33_01145 [Thaumarchaeota archaeon]|nr:hypothetical protein [Nitrososphaerota archaeon]